MMAIIVSLLTLFLAQILIETVDRECSDVM